MRPGAPPSGEVFRFVSRVQPNQSRFLSERTFAFPLSVAGAGAVPSLVCPYHALLMTVASAEVRQACELLCPMTLELPREPLHSVAASSVGSYRHDKGSIKNPNSAPPQALMAAWVAVASLSGAMRLPKSCFIAICAYKPAVWYLLQLIAGAPTKIPSKSFGNTWASFSP